MIIIKTRSHKFAMNCTPIFNPVPPCFLLPIFKNKNLSCRFSSELIKLLPTDVQETPNGLKFNPHSWCHLHERDMTSWWIHTHTHTNTQVHLIICTYIKLRFYVHKYNTITMKYDDGWEWKKQEHDITINAHTSRKAGVTHRMKRKKSLISFFLCRYWFF